MRKHILILFVFIFLSFFHKKAQGQELPIYSQYMFNEYLINSAYGGTYYFTPIILNHRIQWMDFGESAPQTSSLSMHTALGGKSAIGSSMIYDQTNPITRTQMELSYGYHTSLSQKNNFMLSMALSGTWNMLQYTYKENITYSELTENIADDVNQVNENSSTPDMNFGIVLFSDKFDLGLSVRNLLSMEPINNEVDNNDRTRYLLIHGSYFAGSPKSPIGIIPSFVVRKMGIITYNSLFEFDLNLKLIYKNNIWTGFSYRTHEKAMCAMIGFNTGSMFFGWSYDIGTSDLGAYHNGSHNIAIGFKIGGKKKRKIRNQTPLYLNMDSEWRKIKFFNTRRHKSAI